MRSNPSWHHSTHHSPCVSQPSMVVQRGWAGLWHGAHADCQNWGGITGKVDPGSLLTPPKAGGDAGCVLPQLQLAQAAVTHPAHCFLQVTHKVQLIFQAAPSSVSLQTLTDSPSAFLMGVDGTLHEETRERDFPAAALAPSLLHPSPLPPP